MADAAIEQLRSAGPAGLEALLEKYALQVTNSTPFAVRRDVAGQRVCRAIAGVAGQHDAHASRLFWHTDLEAAKRVANETGQPILSLHMLGRLTEECSCANSRFFRTVLYANEEISKYLREHYVLHWHSVRPVPLVTIDFGDGRVMKRTLTGNSAHFILDANGSPIEALPGLYGPAAFLRLIRRAEGLHQDLSPYTGKRRAQLLRDWHRDRHREAMARWQADAQAVGVSSAGANPLTGGEDVYKRLNPPAHRRPTRHRRTCPWRSRVSRSPLGCP